MWAMAHPEEARAKEEEERKASRRSSRGGSGPRDNTDYGAFWSGYDKAKDISLDQQVKTAEVVARLK